MKIPNITVCFITAIFIFKMPAAFNLANLPEPDYPGVKINSTSDEYFAAIRYGGFAFYTDFQF